jgi:hypothetical protein
LLLEVAEDNTIIYDLTQSIYPSSPNTNILQGVTLVAGKTYEIYASIKDIVLPPTTTTTTTTTTSTTTTTTTVCVPVISAGYSAISCCDAKAYYDSGICNYVGVS